MEFIPEEPKKKTAERKRKKESPPSEPQKKITRIRGTIDRPMLTVIIVMLCFGAVMIFSASYSYAFTRYGDSFYFVKKQLLFLGLGTFALIVAQFFPPSFYEKYAWLFFGIVSLMLLLVLFIGRSANGAQRWLTIPGIDISIQPSEIMKLAIVLVLARYYARYRELVLDRKNKRTASIYGIGVPILIVGGVCVLIALEKHVSGMIIVFCIGMILIFCAGALKRWFVIAGGIGVIGAGVLILASSHARDRVQEWLHPENFSATDEIYQTLQGLNAVGSGGFLGVGLGQSRLKHNFVSMPQNDFIFSIIAEELGFVGCLAVIALFAIFLWRGFVIANRAPDPFMKLTAIGIVSKVALQAALNIAVVTNTIPNTGITLPFFSYGGSSLVILMAEMGILLSISRYSYQDKV